MSKSSKFNYGTWSSCADTVWPAVEDQVRNSLEDNFDDRDVVWISRVYRDAVGAALPDGVSLRGKDFYGAHPDEQQFEGYPHDEEGCLDIAAIIRGVNLRDIVQRASQRRDR
ncbi:hypothetical protein [Mycolicibacter sinensis]|uniref:Uncharacterized protein n=1 Tax=Mycolicibacter sinensis (strain JDM601) TaxID=875328 RepID=A0A1A3TUM9_MYCSD|nr:hypothetical protein [Mycolicibacter sinensis]OBK86350.1 hypothetical protein A5648_05885 [Mycolicibacter sinensis]